MSVNEATLTTAYAKAVEAWIKMRTFKNVIPAWPAVILDLLGKKNIKDSKLRVHPMIK